MVHTTQEKSGSQHLSGQFLVKALSIEELKQQYASMFVHPSGLQGPRGLPTGWKALDDFLLWSGLPKGTVSLFYGATGQGATQLWSQAALQTAQSGRWSAWVNSPQMELCPWSLHQKNFDLSKLIVVNAPTTLRKLLWALQEMMSLSLFDLIGCDLGAHRLREAQILKLKKLAREHQCGLVFFSSHPLIERSPFYSLILKFHEGRLIIERARQRPTPRTLSMASLSMRQSDLLKISNPEEQKQKAGPSHPVKGPSGRRP